MTDVWEVKGSDSDTEAINFAGTSLYGLKTSYLYDPLNNLSTVTQGGQTRSFSYSTLSKLLSASNPESGTISYVYDANGNLTSKKDARNITTTYYYDALNRVTQRSYDDSITPTVTYTYDDVTHAKGKLTKVSSAISETRYTAFDLLGRVTSSEQRTPFSSSETISTATPRVSTYSYNLSGALIEQSYPSGRVIKNVLDNNGDLSMVQSKKNSSYGYWNYAQNFTYNAAGAVTSMQLGNFKWESTVFNSRLQPTQIALGTTQSAYDVLKLNYAYNSSGQNDNNSNILSQTITVPTVGGNSGFTAVQTYSYDSLNRIHDAKENINNNSTPEWKQTFVYDRFGNRTFDEGGSGGSYLTTTLTRGCSYSAYSPNYVCDKKKFNPTISASNNQIVKDQDGDSTNDYDFDNAGNTTKSADGNTFIYDGENKQIEVKNSSNVTLGKYWYDGDGKRVKKIGLRNNQAEETIFVYDASGRMVAEYSTQLAPTPEVSYLTNDNLGTPRINTDENGAVTARHDYMSFGEEISTSQRTGELGYNSDDVRKQFTSYERDEETDLDFAQARMYASKLGRFTTFDPVVMMPDRQIDPQQINLYAYCRNNPLSFTDPTGMILDPTKWGEDERKAYDNYVAFLNKNAKKYASELATLEQLKKSDVNYVVKLDQSGTDYANGKEGGVTTDGKDVFINIANQGNGREQISLNATFGHELEHARQFDSGEFGFASDKNGNFVDKNGKFVGTAVGVDVIDEVKAWAVTAKLATDKDMMVLGGSSDPAFQFRILDTFNKAATDADKAAVLAKMSPTYANEFKRGTVSVNFSLNGTGVPVGTLIRPTSNISIKDQYGNPRKVFGRTN
ncbi:MAG: RHS repeat-associated core domain-containing protein [Acidobacteria bacterium]|nr:RHS repeat-associated core domain-containing protein [Acidobacteriota bacterium]